MSDTNIFDWVSSRRRFIQAAAVTGVGAFIAACTGKSTGASTVGSGSPSKPSIPNVTVRFTMQPYPDGTQYAVGLKRGYYYDAGIKIDPAPYGKLTLGQDVIPLLLTGGADICNYPPLLLIGQMDQTTAVKGFGFTDIFIGWAVLANPSGNAKSLAEFIQGGMQYPEAVKATMNQLKGKRYAIEVDPGSRGSFLAIAFQQAGMSLGDTQLQLLSDPKTVELAKAGRLDFATPGGSQQTVTLEEAGWKPILTPQDVIKYAQPGQDTILDLTTAHIGVCATGDYLNANMDTAVRFVSVMYRTIDAIQADPAGAAADQLPYLNSVSGTNISAADLGHIYSSMDPLFNFEDAAQIFVDTTSPYYYVPGYKALIKQQQQNGVLDKSKTYNATDVIWAPMIYRKLLDYKQKYDAKLPSLSGSLSPERSALVSQAATFYKNRNYLDATRFLDAAAA